MSKPRVSIIDSFAKLEQVHLEWNALLMKAKARSIFLTWEWISSWSECFLVDFRKLFVITVYDENRLIGVAPWYIRSEKFLVFSLRYIEFLGTPEAGSDYLDVFTLDGKETVVGDAIYDFVMHEARNWWDILFLRDMRANSFFLLQFIGRLNKDGKYAETKIGSFCPIVNLLANNNEFFSILTPHRKAQLRRHFKLLEQQGVVKHECFSTHRAPGVIDPFLSFYEQKKEYGDPQLAAFIKTFALKSADTEWITVDTLTVDGICVASVLHFIDVNRMLQYLMVTDKAFNPKVSLGDTLINVVLESAIHKGMRVYDFLKGSEAFKLRWATNINPSINLLLSQRRRTVSAARMMTHFARNAAKVLIR